MDASIAALAQHRAVVIEDHLPVFAAVLERAIVAIELFAVLLLFVGLAKFVWDYLASELTRADMVTRSSRANLGRIVPARYILMALEVFIVADILATVLSASFASLLFLALLVLVRSVISHFLENEIRSIRAEEQAK